MSQASSRLGPVALFWLLCMLWGSGWLALKIGVAVLPPLLFAAGRFLAAGTALLAMLIALRRGRSLRALPLGAVWPGAALMIAANYGLMAWGATRADSGLAAVVNLTTVPLATALFSRAHGLSRLSTSVGIGLLLGSAGLAVLLVPPVLSRQALASGRSGADLAIGLAAIAVGAACYAWGSVLTRQRLSEGAALELSTLQALGGGAALLLASAIAEPWPALISTSMTLRPVAALGFLVAISVVSTPAYLWLLARWTPIRVAAYAYVCPVIAVAEGVLLGGETLDAVQALGAVILGLSAYLVVGWAPARRPEPASPVQPQSAPIP